LATPSSCQKPFCKYGTGNLDVAADALTSTANFLPQAHGTQANAQRGATLGTARNNVSSCSSPLEISRILSSAWDNSGSDVPGQRNPKRL
jgi:hypothetical protein